MKLLAAFYEFQFLWNTAIYFLCCLFHVGLVLSYFNLYRFNCSLVSLYYYLSNKNLASVFAGIRLNFEMA